MTLGKGNHLIKVTSYNPSDAPPSTFADRLRLWAEANPTGDITERDLAQILCPNESFVIHEVMTDCHYTTMAPVEAVSPGEGMAGFSYVPAVDLKVIY